VRLLALGLALLVAGCPITSVGSSGIGYPVDPTLSHYGLRLRCTMPEDASCTDRALDIVGEAFPDLGGELPPWPLPRDEAQPAIVPFVIEVQRDPPWDWRTIDEKGGRSGRAAIDLTQFLVGRGDAYVRFDESDPAFTFPDRWAERLVDALFVPAS
jgi:hypothetical protein